MQMHRSLVAWALVVVAGESCSGLGIWQSFAA